jgi:NAD(P)-dependent dehydrogenase (short-subunit alcohol dehydrogenase family)
MEANMQGRVVLVTGAARGIGKAVAGQLAERGAAVLVSARDPSHAQATAKELSAVGDVRALPVGLTSPTTPACARPPRPWSGTLGAWTS